MADTLVQSNLEKISSFLQDVQYRSLMINSANYNVRLMRERKTRLPFLDSQTGIAQNPCKLYMSARHRMPGTAEGQLYVYPSQRWCCRKRSYMALAHQAIKEPEGDEHTIVTVENPAAVTTEENNFVYETKTPSGRGRGRKKDTTPKVVVEGEEETPGKPYECQLCGARYKTRQGLSYHLSHTHKGGRANSGGGRSRGGGNSNNNTPPSAHPRADPASYQPQAFQSDALAGLAEFQDNYLGYLSAGQDASPTGQGGSGTTSTASSRRSSGGGPGGGGGVPVLGGNGSPVPPRVSKGPTNTVWSNLASVESSPSLVSAAPAPIIPPAPEPQLRESSPASMPLTEPPEQQPPAAPLPPAKVISEVAEKGRAQPSPYCDFCLGDTSLNKKTGESEELVSCSDCGRSGHPTCLQFTAHMMISVRQYRWQCIECKCCTLCGTSENDDQLLFCDDCDRGYHLYCLRPPLQEPPEGEWSCDLCLQQFHTK
ncbi:zinc finger protein ubi-d4-like isoform X6 [Eriocheir sinensis]|uniref:zinc finger protein ubi-d4-like isoform X6 n=1 Tax=Eriocheir sinensis TaxID=95602 RepID=UPI0021C77280|nr:zinc finger protein ubi-d4-like isoform X6 [Eriocheir sinensis]